MTSTTPTSPVRVTPHDVEVEDLLREAASHPAISHPFLSRFAAGEFPDMQAVLRLYAVEYSAYAAWFPHYLRAVIGRLEQPAHRELLAENLSEEQGLYGDDECAELRSAGIDPRTVQGVPHPQLFRRFCRSIGIAEAELEEPRPAAARWRERFRSFLAQATPAEAVGALGLGTEYVVRPIYQQLVAGILRTGSLRRDEFVFFELHCLVDDKHQADLLQIARDLAGDRLGIEQLRRGMRTALALRQEFWDQLYSRLLEQQLANPA